MTRYDEHYKAEFFDRSFTFRLFSVIDSEKLELHMDYLTLEKTTITIPSIAVIERGWLCHITNGSKVVYQGTVASVSQSRNATTVQLSPMIALFDVQVYKNRSTYNDSKTNLEGWMAQILTQTFIQSGDSVQNIPGLTVTATTATNGIALNLKDNIHDFWKDIARKAIENGKIVIVCEFDPQLHTVSVTISSHAGDSELTIEADLDNVIDQRFTLRDDWGSVNKCIIINQDNESETATYYASDYAAPTVYTIQTVSVESGKTFAQVSKDKADEVLRKSDFDNLIELSFRANDKMLPVLMIGQPVRIIKKGTVYHTVLTGYTIKDDTRTLIFGGIRTDFTKILKLKGAI